MALYCLGRLVFESVWIDPATHVGGLRINIWTSVIVGVLALAYLVIVGRTHPGRETDVYRRVGPAGGGRRTGLPTPLPCNERL